MEAEPPGTPGYRLRSRWGGEEDEEEEEVQEEEKEEDEKVIY